MAAGSTLLPVSPEETVDHEPDARFDPRRLTVPSIRGFRFCPGVRERPVIAVVPAGDTLLASKTQHLIEVVLLCFVDQPRYLAKSVMVE